MSKYRDCSSTAETFHLSGSEKPYCLPKLQKTQGCALDAAGGAYSDPQTPFGPPWPLPQKILDPPQE